MKSAFDSYTKNLAKSLAPKILVNAIAPGKVLTPMWGDLNEKEMRELGKISKKDVRLFLEDLSEKERSGNTMNTYHMAIRFLFENVLEKRRCVDIKYSKVPEKIQNSLSKEEVKMLIGKIENWKHRLMIELMYV